MGEGDSDGEGEGEGGGNGNSRNKSMILKAEDLKVVMPSIVSLTCAPYRFIL